MAQYDVEIDERNQAHVTAHGVMEGLMPGMSEEETALAAAEMWAARNDPDLLTGEIVQLERREPRSLVVSVRLNPRELGEIERAAVAAGMGLSTYMKQSALAAARDASRISRAEVLQQIDTMSDRVAQEIAQVKASVANGIDPQ